MAGVLLNRQLIPTSAPNFFDAQRTAWSAPPIDGVGYIPSVDLLKKSDDELRAIITVLEKERYNVTGWRNHKNLWREKLGLDSTHGKVVLDYGCGCGVEALQFAKAGNKFVYVADIVIDNRRLAERVLSLYGFEGYGLDLSGPMQMCGTGFTIKHLDVFYCAGVLHHIPNARDVLLKASEMLTDDGEIRLMLYSDIGWKISTESLVPPVEELVETNPKFNTFTATFDAVGNYADWYSADKLLYRFGDFLDLVSYDYICSDGAYCVAILKKKVK